MSYKVLFTGGNHLSILNKFREEKKSIKDSIFEHLCDLLNTKKGFGSYPKELGLDSYIYLGSDQKINLQIIADVKKCFENYEKRISHLAIIPITSDSRFLLSFIIKFRIENQACSFHLCFHQQNKFYSVEVDNE